jgi:ribosomal peptide maturation radical SAM protein 1
VASHNLRELFGNADALLVIPPFAGLDRPSLAAHVLQACAARAGFRVRVLYANLALAQELGETVYQAICYAPTSALLGERCFVRAAYGGPPLGGDNMVIEGAISGLSGQAKISRQDIEAAERSIPAWVERMAAAIAGAAIRVVGCSTTFEQTAASVALLNRLKILAPDTIILLGGANCEGEMARGVLTLPARLDYVFSGESEETFPWFLGEVAAGRRPPGPIVQGKPCHDLDALPTPDYSEYFEQRSLFIPEAVYASSDVAWIPYEGSRGCWWGEKHHCTFCGINGQGMQFRQKSAGRVIEELRHITSRHQLRRICMVDNIMPHRYFQTLIPRLGAEVPELHLFYEQKANLTLDQVVALKRAGIAIVQPGIEALSSNVLRLMDKGVTARQNVALLRYARSAQLDMNWNLLFGFPGDAAQDYYDTLAMLPDLRHLQPPTDVCRLSIDRFSPYFDRPASYGIRALHPMDSYFSVLPPGADVPRISYHFVGDYDSGSLSEPGLLGRLEDEVHRWQQAWDSEDGQVPALAVAALSPETFVLVDTRGLPDTQTIRFLDRDEARAVLVSHPLRHSDGAADWARRHRLALAIDGWHVPLATATPDLLGEFERARTRPAASIEILPSYDLKEAPAVSRP